MKQITSLTEYVNTEFPSDYITGDDIGTAHVPVTITKFEIKQVKNPKKQTNQNRLVLHFEDKDKMLVVAKTRANELKALFGDNPQNLIGKTVLLYTKVEKSFGEMKRIIHIKGAGSTPTASDPEDELPTINADEGTDEIDINDIPF